MAKPKRWLAVSCNHGEHIDAGAAAELWKFCDEFKPQYRVHLGDIWDTTAWRAGAGGTADESADVGTDWDAGCVFLRRFKPHLVFLGNHDVRPQRYLRHPNALLRRAAELYTQDIENLIQRELRAEMVGYDIRTGWRTIGGTAFGHGFMFSENAVRDHVEMLGRPVVMGHLHYVGTQVGRAIGAPAGYCVGCLADIGKMDYGKHAARQRDGETGGPMASSPPTTARSTCTTSADRWQSLLQEYRESHQPTRPCGGKTSDELMAELGITRWTLREMLRLAARDNRVRRVMSGRTAFWIFDAPTT